MAERPVSLLAAQTANLNRDPKKRKAPYNIDEFYLYEPIEAKNAPSERYGASAVWLAESGMMPSFALFCFPALRKSAGSNLPTVISFGSSNAILLAPTEQYGGVKGLLVAEKSASGQVITMESPCGQSITVRMPIIASEVIAKEDIVLEYC